MAQTVQYNPKTGAKLKKGESVNVNGKTFTQGSSNIYGDTVKTTNANKSTGSDSVKKMQQEINKRGAKVAGFKPLAVDGIVGPNTKREMARFGYGDIGKNVANFASGKVTSKTTSPGGSGFSNFLYTQPRKSSNYTSGVKASSKSNSPLGMLGRFLKKTKDSILSSAKPDPGMAYNPDDPIYGGGHQIPIDERTITDATQAISPFELIQQGGSNLMAGVGDFGNNVIDKLSSTMTYDSSIDVNGIPTNITPVDNSIDLNTIMSSPGLEYDTQTTDKPITSGTTDKSLTIDNPEMESLDMTNQTLGNSNNINGYGSAYNSIAKNNTMSINNGGSINPWEPSVKSGSEFTGQNTINYPKQVANIFTDIQTADDWFNRDPEGRVAKADLEKKGYTVDDVLKNIVPTKNGIRPPQTWNEFNSEIQKLSLGDQKEYIDYMNSKFNGINPSLVDTTGMTPELKAMAESQNKMMIEQSKYLNEQQKMSWTNSYLDRIEAEKEIKAAEEMLLKRETAIEDRLRLNTKKMKAEMKAQEAEDEKARINGMNYMTGYLAKIGALDVSSSAAFGLNALETKYQEQKAANRQKYLFAIEEMELDANEKINNLQYDLEKSKLEISRDLSKDERQVRADMFKLDYDYKIKALEINTQYQERLMIAKEKQKSDSNKANNDWRDAFFTISAGDMFASLPAEFRNQWLQNNQISPEGFKTTQEDLAKDFGNWSKSQPNNTGVTDATRTKVLKYLKKENGKDLIGYEEDIAAFDSDPAFRNMILGSIE